jgi:CheY-like chemotaxis protein
VRLKYRPFIAPRVPRLSFWPRAILLSASAGLSPHRLSAKGLKTDIVTGLGSGADDYLTKPFDSGELKARLRTGQRIPHFEGRLVEARENMRFKAAHDSLTSLF